MIGLAVGIAAGAVQYWVLSIFTARVTGGAGINVRTALLLALQLLLPLIVLVAVGFLRRSELLPAALGIIAALLVGAVAKFIITARKTRGRRDNNG